MYKFLNIIWDEEKIPTQWLKGMLVKLPNKDLGLCENLRSITLLSVASKIVCRIILNRIKEAIVKFIIILKKNFGPENVNFYCALCLCSSAYEIRAPVYADVDLSKVNDAKLGDIRESIASMKSDIESLKHRQKRVSMVACLKGSTFTARGAGSMLQILAIQTIYGITPSSQYRNGIFTCKDRGLYMVFATITSHTLAMYKLIKNKTLVSRGLIGGNQHWSSGSSIAFVQLDVQDQISIVADQRMQIGDRSCFGVLKID
ncbi:unnamed protein product [Mytilus coruscus]|uniref:C1q domain-containing protein n=1 Tax=Mytilus coruscus TaxID=42192 RepID=A0A6J8B736_MYTCO|nr:unnamed protein product [Mytilus coruscus]